ncbi:MAG: hypothetical protein HN345_10110 [Planctomycetaceae bacterium]|jgi:hypothetical protein|nr:hypothetical protein [Planctomycetaceae bacterium]
MKWQEYQEAVALFYEQLEGIGKVKRNVFIRDKITGQNRQIDVLIEIEERGHELTIVVDAKFHSRPLDVKEIEEVLALSLAVKANKTVIVALNGWTKPAEIKAQHEACDLRILGLDEALELLVPNMWKMCPICGKDCIVLDQEGMTPFDNGLILWWLAGQCRECKTARVVCQDCGCKMYIEKRKSMICGCRHEWSPREDGIYVELNKVEPTF